MIDREKVEKCLAVLDQLPEEQANIEIHSFGKIEMTVYPKHWYLGGKQWSDDRRHEVLALCTPLVGRLDKQEDGGNIGYRGEKDDLTVRLNYVDKCKIVGHKTVTKTVKREIKPAEYEEVEETVEVAISDCDIRTGKFSESDIEVPA